MYLKMAKWSDCSSWTRTSREADPSQVATIFSSRSAGTTTWIAAGVAIIGDTGVTRAERTLLNRGDKFGWPITAIRTENSQFLMVVGLFNFLTFTITLQRRKLERLVSQER